MSVAGQGLFALAVPGAEPQKPRVAAAISRAKTFCAWSEPAASVRPSGAEVIQARADGTPLLIRHDNVFMCFDPLELGGDTAASESRRRVYSRFLETTIVEALRVEPNEPLSFGLSAEGVPEYITQRARWCLGTIQVALLGSGPVFGRGYTFTQRWHYVHGLLNSAPHVAGIPILIHVPAFSIVMVITWLLLRGARESVTANNIMVGIKLVALGLFVIAGLFVAQTRFKVPRELETNKSLGLEFREGLAYIRGNTLVASIILMAALIGFFGFPLVQQIPALARDVLKTATDTETIVAARTSQLYAAQGVGAMVAAFLAAAIELGVPVYDLNDAAGLVNLIERVVLKQ